MSIDRDTLRRLEDEQQAAYLAEHGDPSPYEWPIIAVAAAGIVLILVFVCYQLAERLAS